MGIWEDIADARRAISVDLHIYHSSHVLLEEALNDPLNDPLKNAALVPSVS